jgi:hypothetical protein
VSRIEEQLFVHSGVDVHVAVQTDAAINAGASGGPVMQRGRVVGVAFQAALQLENVGYFIADEVVRRFLLDVEDGRYEGYPDLGVDTIGMENPALRGYAGMQAAESGVWVHTVVPGSSADGLLHEADVILSVEGRTIANDGSVQDGTGRVSFGMLVDRLQIGDEVSLRVLRDGRRFDVAVPLAGADWIRARSNGHDRSPRYYVYAGLVFAPLELELLKTYGDDWRSSGPRTLVDAYVVKPHSFPERLREERVVLWRRLKHTVNANMAWYGDEVVDRVNGREIRSLESLVQAFEQHEGEYHLLEFESNRRLGVLDRREAEQANREILERYGIRVDRNL